jgi:peptide deformylase
MFRILEDEKGVGLAANQIGIPLKICVTIIDGVYNSYINPSIVGHDVGGPDHGVEDGIEGCLSLPDELYMVKRFKHTCFSYTSYTNDYKEKTEFHHVYGLESRCIQHEIDHLNGILISHKGVKV